MWRMICALLVSMSLVPGCTKKEPQTIANEGPTSPVASVALEDGQTLSGPYTSGNLAVYLVHGPDRTGGQRYLTLAEAMEQNKLIVHETGDVNTLAIECVSDDIVFIPAGSVVKGGKQDRTLGSDVIITRADGKMPIDAFCVEQGRWQQRGDETVAHFASAPSMVAGRELKIAANANIAGQNKQGEVWENVARAQDRLSTAVETDVRGEASASSFQLTMENQKLRDAMEARQRGLVSVIEGRDDVVGWVYAINGQPVSGNVYASPDLFRKLWPMLLETAVVEAIAEASVPTTQPSGEIVEVPAPALKDAAALLAPARTESAHRQINGRTTVNTFDGVDSVQLDTEDRANGYVLHRNVLKK